MVGTVGGGGGSGSQGRRTEGRLSVSAITDDNAAAGAARSTNPPKSKSVRVAKIKLLRPRGAIHSVSRPRNRANPAANPPSSTSENALCQPVTSGKMPSRKNRVGIDTAKHTASARSVAPKGTGKAA